MPPSEGTVWIGAAIAAGVALYFLSDSGSASAPKKTRPKAPIGPKGSQGPSTPETDLLIQGCGCSTATVPVTVPPRPAPSTTQGVAQRSRVSWLGEVTPRPRVRWLGDAAMCPADRLLGFPADLKARDAYVLQKVKDGEYYVNWLPVTVTSGGHKITFWVSGDALKIDGVRVEVSAFLQQQMADVMSRSGGGVSLMTPRMVDLVFLEAYKNGIVVSPITRSAPPTDWVNTPPPKGSMTTSANMVTQSIDIDKLIIAKAGSLDAAKDKIVSTVGKVWSLSNTLPGKIADGGQAAMNYGWNMFTQPILHQNYDPVTPAKNANGTPMRVFQGPGLAHNFNHQDYSQNAQFVLDDVVVDDQPMKLQALLSNPTLAPVVSHEGVMTVFRQPGVPMVGA